MTTDERDPVLSALGSLATVAPAGLGERVFAGWLRAPSRLGEVFGHDRWGNRRAGTVCSGSRSRVAGRWR